MARAADLANFGGVRPLDIRLKHLSVINIYLKFFEETKFDFRLFKIKRKIKK